MKVKVLQEDINKALSICSRFSSTRVQLPVLANILIETQKNKLRIASTNLEVSVSQKIAAKIEEEGSITVPARLVNELISNLKPGQMNLVAQKETLEIKTPDFESTLSGMNTSDFPSVPQNVGAESLKFPHESFQSSLSKILYSVSSDETRPTLTGVLFIIKNSETIMVSTDGFRLSQKKMKLKGFGEEKRVIVPKGILSELIRIIGGEELEFSFKKTDNQVIFGVENVVMSSRIIEGDFPDFEKIIPQKTSLKVNADKEDLLRNIKLASVFARDSANVVRLELDKNSLEIRAESQQFGNQKGRVDVKLDGMTDKKFTIAFNYRFLEEFLNSVESDDVQIEFSDPNDPALFLDPKDSDYLHIIMPVKIQE